MLQGRDHLAKIELAIQTMKGMHKFDRITSVPEILNGQPCIRGMRLSVRRVVEAVALYPDRAELLKQYPELEDEDIKQALEFAAAALDDEIINRGAA